MDNQTSRHSHSPTEYALSNLPRHVSSSSTPPDPHLDEVDVEAQQSHPLLDQSDHSDLADEDSDSMGRRKSPIPEKQNGQASGSMASSLLEHRRKHASLESESSSTAVEHLISQSHFNLDEPIPASITADHGAARARGFTQLPEKDKKNFLLLVLLYFLQGLPMGLAMGSVPVLLKKHVSYTEMGVFSLASYPYSLKLFWSPIVDSVWSMRVGRRKSWILPIQAFSGIAMLWLAGFVEPMMNAAGEGSGAVLSFTIFWFSLVFLCATQDIAVDGWALTLLSTDNLSYASTAQTVGLTAGQFLTSTIFLAFNSPDFANRWFRSTPGTEGLVSLSGMLAFSGWLYLIVTVGLGIMKKEDLAKNEDGIWDTYKVMWGILRLPAVQSLLIVHFIAKIGFQANDGATQLKLLDKGFGQDNIALAVLIDFPFEMALGYYVGKWSSVYPPMHLWCWAFVGRLFAALVSQVIVAMFPASGVTTGYLIAVILGHVFSTFMSTVMFVAVAAFHAKIADPVYGGTYMTLLAT
jgi:PAT family acetyl-CoA transporter-like MFS transporter 1